MFGALFAVLARFSLGQVAIAVTTISVATVAVAGSAQVMNPPVTRTDPEAAAAPSGTGRRPALAVLASPIEVEPSWTVNRVRYQLDDVPTTIAAISFLVVDPEVPPSEVVVQAIHPEGARYACSLSAAGADVAVTCPTAKPALPVGQANRLTIEVRS